MNKQTILQALKAILPDTAAVLFFVVISCLYFTSINVSDFDIDTSILKGERVLTGHDHTAADGPNRELKEYAAQHGGERSRWSSTIFSGMPTYQISPSYNSTDHLSFIQRIYRLFLPTVASYIFMMLLGFYIMLRCFNFRVHLAALGSVIWAFSSYFFIIIAAGHIWKVYTLCFIPPTIAGMLLCYKGKYLWGVAVTGLFSALQILSNHPQMSYYFLFVMGFIALAFLIDAVRAKKIRQWLRATGCFVGGILLGAAVNLSNLFHTWQYSKETTRGKTELTQQYADNNGKKGDYDREYITQYSYDVSETLTLLVPKAKGGASDITLSQSGAAMKKADNVMHQVVMRDQSGKGITFAQVVPQYFGDPHGGTGTSGPVYVGAFVCFLFVLGLFIVKGPLKWCLVAVTVLSILLSWGKNFMPFTDLFLDYVPLYNKFRAVESILVIAEFTIPFLAMLTLRELVNKPAILKDRIVLRQMLATYGIVGGICLLLFIAPGIMGPFVKDYEFGIYGDEVPTIVAMRKAIVSSDALMRFFVITIGFIALMVYRAEKIKSFVFVGLVTFLCLADMWTANKEYLNNDKFKEKIPTAQRISMSEADKKILEDQELGYRILEVQTGFQDGEPRIANDPYSENEPAYYHRSIGGYHAAKLRRYQELIDAHIKYNSYIFMVDALNTAGKIDYVDGDTHFPVLNMLNMKYMILRQGQDKIPVLNPWANGCAWFVDELRYVNSADEELGSLGQINTKHTAVADESFRSVLGEAALVDSLASVRLIAQEANRMEYEVTSEKGGIVVFSEIYYPGWQCTVDGESAGIGRVNYVLRAVRMPAGTHKVVMTFDPQSVHTTEVIANAALIILLLIVLAIGGLAVWKTGIIQRMRK